MFNRILYSILGTLCGLAVPINWLLWRAFWARKEWWTTWLKSEFAHHGTGYFILAVWSALLIGFLGYLLGSRHDGLEEETKITRDSNFELNELATTDGLTGIFNTRYIHDRLEIEMEAAHERLAPLSCLLVDVDHFKRINDTHGHPYGDDVLVTVAKLLRKLVRRMDAVGRMGGEEFFIVMPNTSQEMATAVAERIRSGVETEKFAAEEKRVKVTVSIGVACFPTAELRNKNALLKAVDEALYTAKKTGRNRVVVWNNRPTPTTPH